MAFIRNTDRLVEGSSNKFFTESRAQLALQPTVEGLQSEDSGMKLRLDVIEGGAGVSGSIAKAQADAQAYADQKVAALVNSAPEVLDTLKELSDALGGDASFASTVAGQIGDVDAKVDQEVLDRQSAVSALQSSVSLSLSELESSIQAEESRAMLAEGALDTRLLVLETDPVTKSYVDAEISSVEGQVSTEQSRAEASELALSNRIDPFEQAFEFLEIDGIPYSKVSPSLYFFKKLPASGDFAGLVCNSNYPIWMINKSVERMLFQNVPGPVTVETNFSAAGDASIGVTFEEGVTTLGDIVAALNTASNGEFFTTSTPNLIPQSDPSFEGSGWAGEWIFLDRSSEITGLSNLETFGLYAKAGVIEYLDVLNAPSNDTEVTNKLYVDGQISAEQSRAEGAESALSGRLDALEADPVTKTYVDGEVSGLQGQINQEISDRQSAITSVEGMVEAEETRAMGAESALSGRLDLLEADPVTKTYVDGEVSALQGQIDTEKGRIDAILSASEADKDSFAEIVQLINSVDTSNDSAFASYVLSNDAALAQEVSDRQAGDSALSGRLDALELDPTSKSYVDGQVSALDSRLDALEADPVTKSYVDGEVSSLQAEDQTLLKLDGSRSMTGMLNMGNSSIMNADSVSANHIETTGVKNSGKSVSKLRKISSNYTPNIWNNNGEDFVIGVESLSQTLTITLAGSIYDGVEEGQMFMIKDMSGQASQSKYISIVTNGSAKIDGEDSYEIKVPYESISVIFDGSNWFIL